MPWPVFNLERVCGGGGGHRPHIFHIIIKWPCAKARRGVSLTLLCEWGNIEQCIIFICNQLKMTTLKSPRLGMQYLFHSIQYVVGDLSWHSIYFNVYYFWIPLGFIDLKMLSAVLLYLKSLLNQCLNALNFGNNYKQHCNWLIKGKTIQRTVELIIFCPTEMKIKCQVITVMNKIGQTVGKFVTSAHRIKDNTTRLEAVTLPVA